EVRSASNSADVAGLTGLECSSRDLVASVSATTAGEAASSSTIGAGGATGTSTSRRHFGHLIESPACSSWASNFHLQTHTTGIMTHPTTVWFPPGFPSGERGASAPHRRLREVAEVRELTLSARLADLQPVPQLFSGEVQFGGRRGRSRGGASSPLS